MRKFLLGVGICGFVYLWGVFDGRAQVKVYGQQELEKGTTRMWEMTYLEGRNYDIQPAQINIIETAGVCLYVARSHSSSDPQIELWGMPKSQLKPGVGCQ